MSCPGLDLGVMYYSVTSRAGTVGELGARGWFHQCLATLLLRKK